MIMCNRLGKLLELPGIGVYYCLQLFMFPRNLGCSTCPDPGIPVKPMLPCHPER